MKEEYHGFHYDRKNYHGFPLIVSQDFQFDDFSVMKGVIEDSGNEGSRELDKKEVERNLFFLMKRRFVES